MTRYTWVCLLRILAFSPALWGFYFQVYDHFLTNTHIYMRYKQTCVYGVTAGRHIRGIEIILSAINHFMYDGAEK